MIYWVRLEMLRAGPDLLIPLVTAEGPGHSGSARPSKPKLGSKRRLQTPRTRHPPWL